VRKKPRNKASGPNWGLIAGIAMGVVGLVVGGVVIYMATRPKAERAAAASNDDAKNPPAVRPGLGLPAVNLAAEPLLPPAPPLPEGWVRFTAEDMSLSMYLPGQPSEHAESGSDIGGHRVRNLGFSCELPGNGGECVVGALILPAGATMNAEEEGQFLRLPRHQIVKLGKGQVTAERATTLAGAPATELEFTIPGNITGVLRYGFVRAGGKSMFVIARAFGLNLARADARTFLDSIRPAGR
jgi:hypothetical protein